jgi:hypothetical protein
MPIKQIKIPGYFKCYCIPESIAQVRQEIARNQAQLDFMQAVASTTRDQPVAQLSMFGESVPVKTERRKRR